MKFFLAATILVFATFSVPVWSKEKINVGSSPVISSAGIYLAEHFGYFKQEGLDVEISDFANSGAPMTLLLSKGDLDVGAGNLNSGLFNAILQGQDFKIVADKGHVEKGFEYIQLLVRKDLIDAGKFKSLKDLKGFKIGVTALDGVSQQVVIDRILKSNGLFEKDVEYVKMSYAEMNIALRTKNIEAAVQIEPFLTKALQEGSSVSVARSWEVHPNQQSAALFYSPKFMKRREEAIKFMKAYLRGVKVYKESVAGNNPEGVLALKKIFKIDDKAWEKMIPVGLHEDGRLNTSDLMEDLKWYHEKGYLKKIPREMDVVDATFASEAFKQLKK